MSAGSGYVAVPIAECAGDGHWRAGVLLCADDPRGDRPAKSLSDRRFDSEAAAIDFAQSEFGNLGV